MKEVNYQGIEVNKKGIINFWSKDINPITGKKDDKEIHFTKLSKEELIQKQLRKDNVIQLRTLKGLDAITQDFNYLNQ